MGERPGLAWAARPTIHRTPEDVRFGRIAPARGSTIPSMSQITPAGWYPDPAAPGVVRWWDGAGWTPHVQAAQPAAPVVVVTHPRPVAATNHTAHLILTLATCGAWAPFWLLITAISSRPEDGQTPIPKSGRIALAVAAVFILAVIVWMSTLDPVTATG